MSEIAIVIAGDANELGPNQRLSWQSRLRKVKGWRQKARLLYRYHGAPVFSGRVQIRFLVRRGRPLDPDNLRSSGALKAVIDGFVDEGMVKDDSAAFVLVGEVAQETGPRFSRCPELVVMLTPVAKEEE